MKPFALVTDSGCALTADLRSRFGIDGFVRGNVTFPDGHTEKADLDWEKRTPKEFFSSLTGKKFILKTSCPNIDEIAALFLPFVEEGREVLMVTVSHALSGTYNFAVKAAEKVMSEHPGSKIRVVDSLRYSTAQGLLLVRASALREQGKSCDEAADWIEQNKNCFHQMGIMDDLFFLARTGRVNKAAAFMGSLVGVEPMADFSPNGLSTVLAKGKGKKKSLDAVVSYFEKLAIDPKGQIVFLAHSLREKEANYLKKTLEERVGPKEIILTSVDMFCGANIGPGLVALFFYGQPITDDLSKEKEILAECLQKK